MKRVLVLGGSGMLGSMVTDYLSRYSGLAVRATVRELRVLETCRQQLPSVEWSYFDALDERSWQIDEVDWIVNAIGIIKPFIHENNPGEVERAIDVNSRFPFRIGLKAQNIGAQVLQIATDCVFSGKRGGYSEDDAHDALDVYGKTKSLGEAPLPNVHHLRCSIVGPELGTNRSLLEWLLGQPQHSRVRGFRNHHWNGLTTLHFAKLCAAIAAQDIALPHLQHVLASGEISKAGLLSEFAGAFNRQDITIEEVNAEEVVDRTLKTCHDGINRTLWAAAGYETPPTVTEMVAELGQYSRQLARLN